MKVLRFLVLAAAAILASLYPAKAAEGEQAANDAAAGLESLWKLVQYLVKLDVPAGDRIGASAAFVKALTKQLVPDQDMVNKVFEGIDSSLSLQKKRANLVEQMVHISFNISRGVPPDQEKVLREHMRTLAKELKDVSKEIFKIGVKSLATSEELSDEAAQAEFPLDSLASLLADISVMGFASFM